MSDTTSFCFYHSGTNATSSCERCNRPVCSKCSYSIKNSSLPFYEIKSIRDFDLEDDNDDELYWCYPCYFDFLNQKRLKNESFFHKIRRIGTNLILSLIALFTTLWFISIVFSENKLRFNIDNNIILASIFIFLIAFFLTLLNNKRTFQKKKIEFDEIKNNYFKDLGLLKVSFPITCYYCGKEIKSDSFACLNINCTLDE